METAADPAVTARGIRKRFGALVAVDGIDLEARRGRCVGLLGPNGAGKTTTIEILEGLRTPDEGEVRVLGRRWDREPREIQERIGVQLQETELQEKLTVFETLRMFASLYDATRGLSEVLELVGLSEKRDARTETLSGGQKQRLTLGCALVNRPELLFLDEPTTGLDPQARRRVWEIVEEFKEGCGTVLLTTHYMDEAERLADEIVIVDRGRVIQRGSPRELIANLGAESIVRLHVNGAAAGRASGGALTDAGLLALPGAREVRREPGAIELVVEDTRACIGALLGHLRQAGVELEDLSTHRPTLEDVFVALTGRHLRDG